MRFKAWRNWFDIQTSEKFLHTEYNVIFSSSDSIPFSVFSFVTHFILLTDSVIHLSFSTMFLRIIFSSFALAAFASASLTYKGFDLSSLKMMIDDEYANYYTESGTLSTAEDILGGNMARLR